MNLLDLPYDVRQIIYEQLFPPLRQIYILAEGDKLTLMNNSHTIHTSILRVNHLLHAEAAGYLFNSYLFNIVGQKQDCLKLYPTFLELVAKHARQKPQVYGFSNGVHSATSCLSIQAGAAQLATLESRRRGTPRTIAELQREASRIPTEDTHVKWLLRYGVILAVLISVLMAVIFV